MPRRGETHPTVNALIHRILYRTLPLEGYLRTVSRLYFVAYRLGLGRRNPATEYVYHLPQLVHEGDICLDIGANLGYYARPLAEITGPSGRVYAVEPVPPILHVLCRNLCGCRNVEVLPYALGTENRTIRMGNDSARTCGYFGTGQNFVNESQEAADVEFTAQMRRGSDLFGSMPRIDFIKCDIEGYETVVMEEMRALIARHRPTVLIETGGGNRPQIIRLFTELGYRGYTLDAEGCETPLTPRSTKDIIFRPETPLNPKD